MEKALAAELYAPAERAKISSMGGSDLPLHW